MPNFALNPLAKLVNRILSVFLKLIAHHNIISYYLLEMSHILKVGLTILPKSEGKFCTLNIA